MGFSEYYEGLREKTWAGQSVKVDSFTFGDIIDYVPEFRRESFGEGNNVNQYLEKIVRLPVKDDNRTIPVAVVSRRYALVQHHEVIRWLEEGVKAVGLNPYDLGIELVMSEYGERLKLIIKLPGMSFDPGDGIKIDQFIEAHNSVDCSCALEFFIARRRLVCLNGMWRYDGKDQLKKIHNIDWMNRKDVASFIKTRVTHVGGFKDYIKELLNHSVSINLC